MFVKIDYDACSEWHECDKVTVGIIGSSDGDALDLRIHKNDSVTRVDVPLGRKSEPGIYLLNDAGETVDVIHKQKKCSPRTS